MPSSCLSHLWFTPLKAPLLSKKSITCCRLHGKTRRFQPVWAFQEARREVRQPAALPRAQGLLAEAVREALPGRKERRCAATRQPGETGKTELGLKGVISHMKCIPDTTSVLSPSLSQTTFAHYICFTYGFNPYLATWFSSIRPVTVSPVVLLLGDVSIALRAIFR